MTLQDDIENLKSAGFTGDEIQDWTAQRSGHLLGAGFSQQEVNDYMGIKDPSSVDLPGVRNMVKQNLSNVPREPPLTFPQAVAAGLQMSVPGLAIRGKMPDQQLTGNESTAARLGYKTAETVGDIPAMVAGAALGAGAGAETGPGAAVTGMAGAFALPAGLRATLMDSYTKGDFKTFGDFWSRALEITKETARGWTTGAATGATGGAAEGVLAGAAPVVAGVGKAGAELTTMTTVGDALNGKVPTAQDFVDGAIVLLGAKGATEGSAYLRNTYAKSGIDPAQAVADAKTDVTVAQDIAAGKVPKAYGAGMPSLDSSSEVSGRPLWSTSPTESPDLQEPSRQISERTPPSGVFTTRPTTPSTTEGGISSGDLSGIGAPYHGTDDVSTLKSLAASSDGDLHSFLKTISENVDGAELAGVRAKDEQSLNRKLDDRQPNEISDYLGGRIIVDSRQAADDVLAQLQKFGTVTHVDDFMNDEGRADGYRAIHAQVMGSNGLSAEVQIQPRDINEAGADGHALYKQRQAAIAEGDLPKAEAILAQGRQLYGDAWEKFNQRSSPPESSTSLPPEIEKELSDHQEASKTPFENTYQIGSDGLGGHVVSDGRGNVLTEDETSGQMRWVKNANKASTFSSHEEADVAARQANENENSLASHGREAALRNKYEKMADEGRITLDQFKAILKRLSGEEEGDGGRSPPGRPPSGGVSASVPHPESAQQKILSKISIGERQPKEPLSWNKFYAATVDKLDPVRRMVESMQGNDDTGAIGNSYKLLRLLPGAGGKAQQFLENGTFDFKTLENTGKSLKEVLDPVKDDLNGLRAYAAASRAIELEGRGINSGMDLDAAKEVVSKGKEKYDPVFRELNDYQTRSLKYLKDSGVLSDEAFKAMKAQNGSYVPFYRVMDQDSGGLGFGARVKNPVKAIKGSDREIVDPIESVIRNTYAYLTMAERNAAVKSFFDQASKEPDPGQYFEKVPTSFRPTTITDKELETFLDKNGLRGTEAGGLGPEKMPSMTVFRAMRTPLAKDEVGYFEDGKQQVMKVDPDLAEAFNGVPRPAHGLLFSLLRGPAALLRSGLVTPEFIIRHLERNQLSASALAQKGNIPIWDTFKGMISYLGKDDDYQNFLKSGGLIGATDMMDRDAIQDQIKALTGEGPDNGVMGKVWNLVKTPFDLLHSIQQSLETATRLGSFKRAMAGLDVNKENIVDAGYASRNIAPDPSRIGNATATWNGITALFNTEIQHTDQLVSALRDRPIPTLAKIFAGVTVPSVLLWAANHNSDEWKEAHQWERDFFWLVPMGGYTLRIPKPFLLGEIFGSGPERLLDKISGADADNRGIRKFVQDFAEWGVPNFMPSALKPILEQTTNYSFFKGSALVPDHLMQQLPEYRYSEYTSEATKAIAGIVGHVPYIGGTSMASPIVIDNYLYNWTGGLGTYALSLADAALRKSGVLPDPPLPAATLADIPVIKGFVVRYPSATADSIQKFQEDYQQKAQVFNTFQALMKQGDPDAAVKVMQSNPAAMAKLDSVNKALSQQNQLVRMIYKNPDIPPDEKRQIIDSTYFNMIAMTRSANDLMKELNDQQKR